MIKKGLALLISLICMLQTGCTNIPLKNEDKIINDFVGSLGFDKVEAKFIFAQELASIMGFIADNYGFEDDLNFSNSEINSLTLEISQEIALELFKDSTLNDKLTIEAMIDEPISFNMKKPNQIVATTIVRSDTKLNYAARLRFGLENDNLQEQFEILLDHTRSGWILAN